MSLVDRARALCAVADDVQRATIEASRRIAALHRSPNRTPKKKKITAHAEEPPDVCARPPLDVPPPRGEGWRRLGPVSVVRGSNRVSAPPQTNRRALTREMEVYVGGSFYKIVPADIDPGGGFCISLDRDYAGDTNMACMLYLRKQRKKKDKGEAVRSAEASAARPGQAHKVVTLPVSETEKRVSSSVRDASTRKVMHDVVSSLPPNNAKVIPAPFGSVGETPTLSASAPTRAGSPSPFSAGMERQLDTFAMSRPGAGKGCNTAVVRGAQRRARRRARNTRRNAEDEEQAASKEPAAKPATLADIERLKASRRAALARVASAKQKEDEKREAKAKSDEERRKREPEAAKRADALRSVAAARAGAVAAEKRERERKSAVLRQAEAEAKRERVAAVLAIRREERRRELALQRQEDERAEKMRLHEVGGKYECATAVAANLSASTLLPPAVQSARSFFSISGSPSASETIGEPDGLASASSAPTRRNPPRSGYRKVWGRVDSHHTEVGDTPDGQGNSEGDTVPSRETGRGVLTSTQNQPQAELLSGNDLNNPAADASLPSSSAVPDAHVPSPMGKGASAGSASAPRQQDDGGSSIIGIQRRNGQELSSSTQASSSPTIAQNPRESLGASASWARTKKRCP
ncbi:unnamed protein product [Scytosiphon promiscuus]